MANLATPAQGSAPAAQGWGGREAALSAGQALGLLLMVVLAWLFLQAVRIADARKPVPARASRPAGPPRPCR